MVKIFSKVQIWSIGEVQLVVRGGLFWAVIWAGLYLQNNKSGV